MNRRPSILALGLILLTLLLLPVRPASAEDVGARLAAALRDLPSDQIPSGILYDRVIGLSHLATFDGSALAAPVSLREWRQVYSEMCRASLRTPAWPAPPEMEAGAPGAGTQNGPAGSPAGATAAPVADNGPSAAIPIAMMNLFYQRIRPDALTRGALVVQAGRLQLGTGPAFESHRLFAAAPLRDHTYFGREVRFRLDPHRFFTNDPARPQSLLADFDDGLGFVPVRLDEEKPVHYATTGSKTIRWRLTLTDGTELQGASLFEVRELSIPLPNDTLHITATIPYQGIYGTGDAYVDLAPGHSQLVNPVVILEGFDADNSMNWPELYSLLNRQNLLENLRSQGYDAVVLNYTDATNYIEVNGYVAVQLLTQVRAAIAPNADVALVGASMGGLVGRYALAYMEKNNLPHSVRTFISFDGPQEGADIPLGIQYWLWFFASQSSDAATYLAELDRPAARQMLVYHHTDPPTGGGQSDPLRAQFTSELSALGQYPTQPRLVAIANGSGDQVGQGFNPGAEILQWEYTSFLVDITGDVWAVPNVTSHTIFHGAIDYIFLPPNEVTVTVAATNQYDNAPGGWRDTMAEIDSVDTGGYGDIIALFPNHCFIPSISSLDLNTSNLFYNISGDPNILLHTPFAAVYFPATNEEHVDINAENAPWFLAEIERPAAGVTAGTLPPAPLARIEPATPNPFDFSTRIRYSTPQAGPARLAVYDAAGRQVAMLAEGSLRAGAQETTWDGRDAAGRRLGPGIYLLQLRGEGFAANRKVVLQ